MVRKRLQVHDLAFVGGPTGPPLRDLRAGRAQQKNGRVRRQLRHMLDEIDQGRLGPVDILDHGHHRPPPGHGFEQLPHRPERLLDRVGP